MFGQGVQNAVNLQVHLRAPVAVPTKVILIFLDVVDMTNALRRVFAPVRIDGQLDEFPVVTKQFLRILEQVPKAGFKFLRRVVDTPEAVIGAVHEMNRQQRIIKATADFIEERLAFVVKARNIVKLKTNMDANFVLIRFLQATASPTYMLRKPVGNGACSVML